MTLAERLAGYTRSLRYANLPPEVVHEVKRRVLDSLGCAMGAYAARASRIARQLAHAAGPRSGSCVWGSAHKSSADLAAFANGTMVRYLDYNDTYLSKEPAHPSDNIPAAFALAEAMRLSGKEFIAAVVIGYEAQCRLADAASLRARGWDHVTYGAFSVACLASRLLGLSAEQARHAIALAGVANNALRQTRVGTLSAWKACAFANVARNAIVAAELARRGMTGPSEIFEGQFGFWNLVSGPFQMGPLGGEGSEPYKILDTYIKFFPAEYHAQTGIEAALKLRPMVPSLREVSAIEIETFDACVDIIAGEPEKWEPTTRETADHSLPYCVAVALHDGAVTLESFAPKRYSDPEIIRFMKKIRVKRNPELSALYPQAMPIAMRVELGSGKTLQVRCDHARGHPQNPMPDGEVEAKFRSLAAPLLPRRRVEKILEYVWNLEKISNLALLSRSLLVR